MSLEASFGSLRGGRAPKAATGRDTLNSQRSHKPLLVVFAAPLAKASCTAKFQVGVGGDDTAREEHGGVLALLGLLL